MVQELRQPTQGEFKEQEQQYMMYLVRQLNDNIMRMDREIQKIKSQLKEAHNEGQGED